jgi:HlyD family secretion protein
MTEPTHDLSGLKIRRDDPSPEAGRAIRRVVWLAVAAVAVVAAVLLWMRRSGGPEVTVDVAQVSGGGGKGSTGVTANGYVVARTKASVAAKIAGRLATLRVSEGSVVRKGEVIATLENQDYRAVVDQAEAEVLRSRASLREAETQRDQLERDLARAQALLADTLISEQEVESLAAQLDEARARVGVQEAAVQSSQAAVAVARANLENTSIRAPFDGTVLRKDAEVGEVVAPVASGGGLTRGAVVTMANMATLEVEVDVNEAYIAQIHGGQPARILLDAYPDTAYRGAVRQIVPTADRQRATVLVKVSILDRDPRILPEMGVRVDFLQPDTAATTTLPAQIFVPAAAVRSEQGESIVWVVRDGRVHRVPVDAGPVSGGRRVVRSGLEGGERIVVGGGDNLKDGERVRVGGERRLGG